MKNIWLCIISLIVLVACGVRTPNDVMEFTVTVKPNNGQEDIVYTVKDGETIPSLIEPTMEGFEFDGWYIDESYSNVFEQSHSVDEDMTLYAKWSVLSYDLTFLNEDGDVLESHTVEFGSPLHNLIPPSVPDKEGYFYIGWDGYIPKHMPSHDVILTAQYSLIQSVELNVSDNHSFHVSNRYIYGHFYNNVTEESSINVIDMNDLSNVFSYSTSSNIKDIDIIENTLFVTLCDWVGDTCVLSLLIADLESSSNQEIVTEFTVNNITYSIDDFYITSEYYAFKHVSNNEDDHDILAIYSVLDSDYERIIKDYVPSGEEDISTIFSDDHIILCTAPTDGTGNVTITILSYVNEESQRDIIIERESESSTIVLDQIGNLLVYKEVRYITYVGAHNAYATIYSLDDEDFLFETTGWCITESYGCGIYVHMDGEYLILERLSYGSYGQMYQTGIEIYHRDDVSNPIFTDISDDTKVRRIQYIIRDDDLVMLSTFYGDVEYGEIVFVELETGLITRTISSIDKEYDYIDLTGITDQYVVVSAYSSENDFSIVFDLQDSSYMRIIDNSTFGLNNSNSLHNEWLIIQDYSNDTIHLYSLYDDTYHNSMNYFTGEYRRIFMQGVVNEKLFFLVDDSVVVVDLNPES